MTKNWTEGKKKKRRRGRSFFTWSDTFSEEKWLWEAIFHNNLFIAMTARWSFLRKKIESHSAIYKASCHILIYLNLFSKLIHTPVSWVQRVQFFCKKTIIHTYYKWVAWIFPHSSGSFHIWKYFRKYWDKKCNFSSMCGLWTYKWSNLVVELQKIHD